jgi:hypothetical protein
MKLEIFGNQGRQYTQGAMTGWFELQLTIFMLRNRDAEMLMPTLLVYHDTLHF